MDLKNDQLQNELIIVLHHLNDIDEGLDKNDINYVKKGLNDIREALDRLKDFLNPEQIEEINRISNKSETQNELYYNEMLEPHESSEFTNRINNLLFESSK